MKAQQCIPETTFFRFSCDNSKEIPKDIFSQLSKLHPDWVTVTLLDVCIAFVGEDYSNIPLEYRHRGLDHKVVLVCPHVPSEIGKTKSVYILSPFWREKRTTYYKILSNIHVDDALVNETFPYGILNEVHYSLSEERWKTVMDWFHALEINTQKERSRLYQYIQRMK